jgi:hypothetical protein
MPQKPPGNSSLQKSDPELYARLKAEVEAPYRGFRKFIYIGFGASGFIGGVIFLAQLIAGQDVREVLPNLGVQVGVVALMVWLFRLENRAERKQQSGDR